MKRDWLAQARPVNGWVSSSTAAKTSAIASA
jgi:hypothetical protein